MKIPWILRLELAVAALRGNVASISIRAGTPAGTQWRFGFERKQVRHWLARRDRLAAKRKAERAARFEHEEWEDEF